MQYFKELKMINRIICIMIMAFTVIIVFTLFYLEPTRMFMYIHRVPLLIMLAVIIFAIIAGMSLFQQFKPQKLPMNYSYAKAHHQHKHRKNVKYTHQS